MGYSQFGEDAVLADLLERIGDGTQRCCEFGMKNLHASNTAALVARGYEGKFMDASQSRLAIPPSLGKFTTEEAWITAENINELLPADLHVLSIDIDGNDSWIWRAVAQKPALVVIECNGREGEYIHPYSPNYKFNASAYGTSKESMRKIGTELGYKCIAETGVNLIFQRGDL